MRTLATSLVTAVMALSLPYQAVAEDLLTDPLPQVQIPDDKEAGKKSVFDDPLSGVIVNRTVTVLGNDFYQYFASYWREKDVSNHFSISVHERPTARFGSEIWVQYRQTPMFRTFLPPARAQTKSISAAAVEIVYRNIAESEVERMLSQSPDLGPEEM